MVDDADAGTGDELEALGEEIDEVRRRAEEHGTIPGTHERTFIDPDGDGEVEPPEAPAPPG